MSHECGECNLCCKLLAIPALEKSKGDLCKNWCAEKLCTIYESRPETCRKFLCLWQESNWHQDFKPSRIGGFFWTPITEAFDGIQCEVELDKDWRGGIIEILAHMLAKNGHHVMVRQGDERVFFQGKGKPMPQGIQ